MEGFKEGALWDGFCNFLFVDFLFFIFAGFWNKNLYYI